MSAMLPSVAHALRTVFEEQADAMSSSAQMALDELTALPGWDEAKADLASIQESAQAAYRTAHVQLTEDHFGRVKTDLVAELHRIRHDMRNLLQNILLRCEMVREDETLPQDVLTEVGNIHCHARICVEALNVNRDILAMAHLLEFPASEVSSVAEPSPLTEGGIILIADDSANSREMLARFLTRLGHTVVRAASGEEAIAHVKREDVDLILLDLVMPDLNGFQVLAALRELGVLRFTPVILISGMDTEANALRGIEMGAEDFLPRPVDLKLLRARVNASLERQRLRERELAQYFTPKLARHLLRHPEVLAAGRSIEVSVLFCDIVGFSSVSERLGPDKTIRWVGAVLAAMSACVMAEDGALVDFSGDQVMALWGAPHDQPDHADRACRCATAMLCALPQLDAVWHELIGQRTEVTIGVNTGNAFVGNIGTPQKFKFGALGTTVNLASRVQSAAKYVRAGAILTEHTHKQLQQSALSRRLGSVRVNNIAEPVGLFELRAEGDAFPENLVEGYEKALVCHEREELQTACALLGKLLEACPNDGPSLLLLSRTVEALLRKDAAPFDSVWTLPGK
jgi:adenylate cyclase